MTDAQHAALASYLRTLADALLLRDWSIALDRNTTDDGCRASVSIHSQKLSATVTLCAAWLAETVEQQRLTLVHELLHAHTGRVCRVMTRLAKLNAGDDVRYANSALDEEEETLVDTLARLLAPALPLPPEVSDAH